MNKKIIYWIAKYTLIIVTVVLVGFIIGPGFIAIAGYLYTLSEIHKSHTNPNNATPIRNISPTQKMNQKINKFVIDSYKYFKNKLSIKLIIQVIFIFFIIIIFWKIEFLKKIGLAALNDSISTIYRNWCLPGMIVGIIVSSIATVYYNLYLIFRKIFPGPAKIIFNYIKGSNQNESIINFKSKKLVPIWILLCLYFFPLFFIATLICTDWSYITTIKAIPIYFISLFLFIAIIIICISIKDNSYNK